MSVAWLFFELFLEDQMTTAVSILDWSVVSGQSKFDKSNAS